jgi:hypothetical protein
VGPQARQSDEWAMTYLMPFNRALFAPEHGSNTNTFSDPPLYYPP